jgi:predicted anti-sigma-YlaC factor YlaD
MNCNQVRELLPDVAAGMDMNKGTEDLQTHISSCSTCAAKLQGFRQTMALLDQWQAPEPGPYFDTRLGARLREEMARPAAGWLHWLRRPVLAASLAVAVVAGALVVSNRTILFHASDETLATNIPVPGIPAPPGTAVGDLQALERDHELYADFELLDELQVQNEVTANP